MLVFFEVGEGTYLTLDLDQEEENGICPVYYFFKVNQFSSQFKHEYNSLVLLHPFS